MARTKNLPVAAPRAEELNPRTSPIGDATIRIVTIDAEDWVSVQDLGPVLKYAPGARASNLLRMRFKTNGYSFDTYLRAVTVANRGSAWFINEEGLRLACLVIPPRRSEPLRVWLDQGSMNANATKTNAGAVPQPALFPEIATEPAAHAKKTPAPLSLKAYCTKLASVIASHLEHDELYEFAGELEGFVRVITERRYCPGLIDARYDLFANANNLRRA